MNQKQLERKVRYWQKKLKLDHWDISCALVGDKAIEGWGFSSVQTDYLNSHMKIKDPRFYEIPEHEKEEEFERAVIHELLHCHTAALRPRKAKGIVSDEEKCVVLLERAFYDLHKEIYE
ncbi:hypothetical protein LCGC14_2158040 [marine sediment metagenome]|uniref:SprT-like domain-containing protein n=1 Tax=marine sediment metagenome TaxID=412755 RepID=A0A0F9EFS9_9ZZZZ|nr:hypothetical protein [Candidatus Aminicenantes bacterium]